MAISRLKHRIQAGSKFDVLVVGAGPAGAVAARGLAASGAQVLLVDKARFPRWKVCGCCLNGAALRSLASIGLSDMTDRLEARALTHACFSVRGTSATLELNSGIAVSRERLDSMLISESVAAGAEFYQETSAKWQRESDDRIDVLLTTNQESICVSTSVVVAADGLAANFARGIPGAQQVEASRARIGAGASVHGWPKRYEPNAIYMAIGTGGYVGLVGVECPDVCNMAAAFDIEFVKSCGGLANSACQILRESGFPEVDGLLDAHWQGTPILTRNLQVPASKRVFLVGDSSGYVEPFTGEGMAWAIASGAAVVDHVLATLKNASPDIQKSWSNERTSILGRRMRHCRWIARALRYPRAVKLGIRLINRFPAVARPYLRELAQA